MRPGRSLQTDFNQSQETILDLYSHSFDFKKTWLRSFLDRRIYTKMTDALSVPGTHYQASTRLRDEASKTDRMIISYRYQLSMSDDKLNWIGVWSRKV